MKIDCRTEKVTGCHRRFLTKFPVFIHNLDMPTFGLWLGYYSHIKFNRMTQQKTKKKLRI